MKITRRQLLKGSLVAGVGATSTGAYGFLYERRHLGVTRQALPVHGLPAALAGLRIGLLTDVHRSRWVSHEDVAAAVAALMHEQPDLIVLGGDYVTWGDRRYLEPVAEALAPLSAPHGVFAVLGNHDEDRATASALVRHGAEVLRDARTRLHVNGAPLELLGIRYWTRRPTEIASLARGATGTICLLAHDPRRLTEAASLGIPLLLSGHTHGGQVVLPGLGAIAAHKFPVVAGVGHERQTTMFVSRGMGTVYVPIRINCPPEVAVLTLTPANV